MHRVRSYIVDGRCVLRYDNEADESETACAFTPPAALLADFSRRVGRDMKAVHGDVPALIKAGVSHKGAASAFPMTAPMSISC